MSKEFHIESYMVKNTVEIPNRPSFSDLGGGKFGKLEVISWGGLRHNRKRNQWWCKCSCGDTGYFLTDASSLKKGLTTSCGCNYKDNGKDKMRGNAYLEDRIDPRYKVRGYRGMEHKCTVICTVCGDSTGEYTGYSIRQRGLFCSCKETDKLETKTLGIEKFISNHDYKLVCRSSITLESQVVDVQCKHCGHITLDVLPHEVDSKCLCTLGVKPNDKASSVYLLRDQNNPSYFKVGKADNPYTRVKQIQNSSVKEGYDHKWQIKGVKWFASDKVAFHVEHLYHKYFKGKELYKYKCDRSRGTLEFDGAGETFILAVSDFDNFNNGNKVLLDYLAINEPKLVLKKGFNTNVNRLFTKNNVTGIFIPSTPYLLHKLGYKDTYTSRQCLSTNGSIESVREALSKIKSLEIEIDGELYLSAQDFFEQHLHLRGTDVNLKLFKDRYLNKKWDAYNSISESRKKKAHYKVLDLDGNSVTFTELYTKYKPLCSYQTMRDKIESGMSLSEVVNYVPKYSCTKVYRLNGRYYSNQNLYHALGCNLKRPTFYNRLGRGWDIHLAALIPENNRLPYRIFSKDLISAYPEIYELLSAKGVIWVTDNSCKKVQPKTTNKMSYVCDGVIRNKKWILTNYLPNVTYNNANSNMHRLKLNILDLLAWYGVCITKLNIVTKEH